MGGFGLLDLVNNYQIVITGLTLVGVLVLFISETFPPHITAMLAMSVLIASGILSSSDALSIFSNPAPIAIGCMLIMSAALEKTGVIGHMGQFAIKGIEKSRNLSIILFFVSVMALSAFVNNTPVVIIMTPIVIAISKSVKSFPSRYLMPLSYISILGGMTTLIGTSTNLLVDGVTVDHGYQGFSMFEMTVPALIIGAAGLATLIIIGPILLPRRELFEQEISSSSFHKKFIAEVFVSPKSPLIGKTINDIQFTKNMEYEIIDLVRNDRGKRSKQGFFSKFADVFDSGYEMEFATAMRDIPLRAGDRLVFKTNKDELLELRNFIGISFDDDYLYLETISSKAATILEGVVSEDSSLIGCRVSDLSLRKNYGSYIIAIHRDKQIMSGRFEDIQIMSGDVILLEGPKDEILRLFNKEKVFGFTNVPKTKLNKKGAIISVLSILAVVTLSATGKFSIASISIVGATLVISTGCLDRANVINHIEHRVLLLIFGMLALSRAMDRTGLAEIIIDFLVENVQKFGPVAILAVVYIITSCLTEFMSNNATAMLVAPIAIGIAEALGYNPRPFLLAVMFAASASFATPIGYQTNTYIYNAGNYKFLDFVKVGLPINIVVFCASMVVLPLFYSL